MPQPPGLFLSHLANSMQQVASLVQISANLYQKVLALLHLIETLVGMEDTPAWDATLSNSAALLNEAASKHIHV